METNTKQKKDERKSWTHFSDDAYADRVSRLIHFNSKAVNSNAIPFGVRLSKTDKVDLPYVAVSTIGPDKVFLDFSGNAGETKAASQVLAVLDGTEDVRFKDADKAEVATIKRFAAQLSTSFTESSNVSFRLRQVLIPTESEEAGYVALTPLSSPGLSEVLKSLLTFERDSAKAKGGKAPYRKRAVLGIGGANPQNVGLRVRSMGEALVFDVPQEDSDMKAAYSVHFKGVTLAPPVKTMNEYLAWRSSQTRPLTSQGVASDDELAIRSNKWTRAKEQEFLRDMVEAVAQRVRYAKSKLNLVPDFEGRVSDSLPDLQCGLFSPELRNQNFIKECAASLLRGLEGYSDKAGKPFSSSALTRLMPEVETLFMEALA